MLLASGGERLGMLPNLIMHSAAPTAKNYLGQNVGSAEVQ